MWKVRPRPAGRRGECDVQPLRAIVTGARFHGHRADGVLRIGRPKAPFALEGIGPDSKSLRGMTASFVARSRTSMSSRSTSPGLLPKRKCIVPVVE